MLKSVLWHKLVKKNAFLWDIMDLGKYIRKNDAKASKQYGIERKCMQCQKLLENVGEPLYYQKFCSKNCKEMYVGMSLED